MNAYALRLGVVALAATVAAGGQEQVVPLSGRVTEREGGRVLAGVSVRVTRQDTLQSWEVTTDSQGLFRFDSLDTGMYTVHFAKLGLVPMTYGSPEPGLPGDIVRIDEAQARRLVVQLRAAAAITGTVLAPDAAAAGIRVEAIRVERGSAGLVRRSRPDQYVASADNRGIYRLFGLTPGLYVVTASPDPKLLGSSMRHNSTEELKWLETAFSPRGSGGVLPKLPDALPADSGGATAYTQVFWPAALSPAAAGLLELDYGSEMAGIDLRLHPSPVRDIQGRLQASGTPPNATIAAISERADEFSALNTTVASLARSSAEGRFVLRNVPEGAYSLLAVAGSGKGMQWAEGPLPAMAAGAPNVTLQLLASLTIRIDVVDVDGHEVPSRLVGDLQVRLLPTSSSRRSLTPAPVVRRLENSVLLEGVLPGEYRVEVDVANGEWSAATATLGDRDLLDQAGSIHDGASQITLGVTHQLSSLGGVVTNRLGEAAAGFYVLLFAEDSTAWTQGSRRIRLTRTGIDGSYSIDKIPPGNYRVAVIVGNAGDSLTDPEFLAAIKPSTESIKVLAGQPTKQDFRFR